MIGARVKRFPESRRAASRRRGRKRRRAYFASPEDIFAIALVISKRLLRAAGLAMR